MKLGFRPGGALSGFVRPICALDHRMKSDGQDKTLADHGPLGRKWKRASSMLDRAMGRSRCAANFFFHL